jgi:ABC-type dipeptide/oligopeptide/nickel transport system ATPase subunit
LTVAAHGGKHKIDFHPKGLPTVGKFVQRDAEMQGLEELLLKSTTNISRQKVVVLYGLGGIGKTQLAVEFARKHHHAFSSVFWIDGASEASLKQSFANMMQRLPQDELTADGIEMLKHPVIDVDAAVRECLRWLSLPSNRQCLLIFDNVDRDFRNHDDPQTYKVKVYSPDADHGSILITSRLASLQRHGSGIKVGTVNTEQARAILENNAGKTIDGGLLIAHAIIRTSQLIRSKQTPTGYSSVSVDFPWASHKPVHTYERQTYPHRATQRTTT